MKRRVFTPLSNSDIIRKSHYMEYYGKMLKLDDLNMSVGLKQDVINNQCYRVSYVKVGTM